jgi:hypothetical protein
MKSHSRTLFLLESGLAAGAMVLALVTAFWPDWIELLFGIDPDGHSGSLEWVIVAALVVAGLTLAILARLEWRRIMQGRPGLSDGLGEAST